MPNNPFISLVIPMYNGSDFFNSGIMSCLKKQDFDDWEAIFVDDASTDDTLEKLKREHDNDNRIQFLHMEKNGGATVARNRGIEKASGTYVMNYDCDDMIDNNLLSAMAVYAQQFNPDMLSCELIIHRGKKSTKLTDIHPRNCLLDRDYIHDQILPAHIGIENNDSKVLHSHCRMMYKKELLEDNDVWFDEEKRKEDDHCYMTEALGCANSIVIVSDVAYHIIHREGSLTSSVSPRFDNIMDNFNRYKSRFGNEYDFLCQDKLHYNITMCAEDCMDYFMYHEENKMVDKQREIMKILTNEEVIYWYLHADNLTGRSKKIQEALRRRDSDKAYRIINRSFNDKRIRRLIKKIVYPILIKVC